MPSPGSMPGADCSELLVPAGSLLGLHLVPATKVSSQCAGKLLPFILYMHVFGDSLVRKNFSVP